MDVSGDQLKEPEISMSDFLKSLKSVKPSVGREDVQEHEKWTQVSVFVVFVGVLLLLLLLFSFCSRFESQTYGQEG